MRIITYVISFCWITFISLSARADFVDMATLSVNGRFVRKVTQDATQPYLVNLSQYKTGDTLRIKLWTDHGAERNAYITLTHLESKEEIEFSADHYYLMDESFLKNEYSISAHFVYEHPKEFEVSWSVFETTLSDQIEQLYYSLDDFVEFMIFSRYRSNVQWDRFIADSVSLNYVWISQSHGADQRTPTETLRHSGTHYSRFLPLTDTEKEYFERFDASDYYKLYNMRSPFYGSIRINNEDLDHYSFEMNNWEYTVRFEFVYRDNRYLLEGIFYEVD